MTTTETVTDRLVALAPADVESLPWQEVGLPGVRMKELFHRGDAVTGLLRLDAGAHEPLHRHRAADHELWLLQGSATIGDVQLTEGSYVHVPAGMAHATTYVGDEGCTLLYVYRPVTA